MLKQGRCLVNVTNERLIQSCNHPMHTASLRIGEWEVRMNVVEIKLVSEFDLNAGFHSRMVHRTRC